MKKKKIILSAGGTGGHLFPAQAVADALDIECEILFVAKGLDSNRYFDRKKYPYKHIQASNFSSKNPLRLLKAFFANVSGIFQSIKIIKRFQPNCVVGFGSFYTFPMLIAALISGVPIILHEQNSTPGKVNRLLSKYALVTAITFPMTAQLLKGKTQVVEFPLRFEMKKLDKLFALNYFELVPDKQTLLVFGGSQGGKGINESILGLASTFSNQEIQIVHFTGNTEMKLKAEKCYKQCGLRACVKEFEKRMDLAFSVADVALTRAGASTIAELIAWNVPAILIPFPFATDDHQAKNGDFFVSTVQGGEMFIEKNLSQKELQTALNRLLKSDHRKKRSNIQKYIKTNNYPKLDQMILRSIR